MLDGYAESHEIIIDRPPEVVFDYVADPENDPEWAPLVESVTRLSDGLAGSPTYEFVQLLPRGQRSVERAEIVELRRPSLVRSTFTATGAPVETRMELTAVGDSTRFRQTNTVRLSGRLRLQYPVRRYFTRRYMREQLVLLKRILEAQT